jgi:hypothetical protein
VYIIIKRVEKYPFRPLAAGNSASQKKQTKLEGGSGMNVKRITAALMLLLGACLLFALAACEQPVSSGSGDKPKPPVLTPDPEPEPGPGPGPNIVTEGIAADLEELEKLLAAPEIIKITIGFDGPIRIDRPTPAQAIAITIMAGTTKTIIGKPGQVFYTDGNCLYVDGNVTLQNLTINVDQPLVSALPNKPGLSLGTINSPLFVKKGALTLGAGSSLTFGDGVMPASSPSGSGTLVIESGGRLIDNKAGIATISELGIWKAGFTEAAIKTNPDGSVDGILQMDNAYFTGPTGPKLDLAGPSVNNPYPLVLSKSGTAYTTTVYGPVAVNATASESWMDDYDTLAVAGGTLDFTKTFTINSNQTMDVMSGIVNIAATRTLNIGGTGGAGTLKLGSGTQVNVKEHVTSGGVLAIIGSGTLITAANSDIVVEQNGKMSLSATLAKVEHDGRITVKDGGEIVDAVATGGQLWNDGSGGSGRTGSLRIEHGGKGTIGATQMLGTVTGASGVVRLDTNIQVGQPVYIELNPTSYTLNGTAKLGSAYTISAGKNLIILDKSELIIESAKTLTLGYDSVSGVNVSLRGRSDAATASNITVENGGTLIDERPFANSAATEQYLWPVSGYTFGGAAERPLITIEYGGLVKTGSGGSTPVIGTGGWLQPAASSNFQVLSSGGDLALTGDAAITSNLWLPQKLTLMNGADLTVNSGCTLFVKCANFWDLQNRLKGSSGSEIILSTTSYLNWTDNPTAESNATLIWTGYSW